MKVVTKAQFADILEISRPRVSQYVARGMPVRDDGKIDYETAVKWIAENVVQLNSDAADKGAKRAERLSRKAAAQKGAEPVATAITGATDADISDLLGLIFNRAAPVIAEAVVASGATCEVAFAAVPVVRDALSGLAQSVMQEAGHEPGSGNEPDGLCWGGMHGQPAEPNWGPLADRAGETVDLDAWKRAEAVLPINADDAWQPAQPGLAVD